MGIDLTKNAWHSVAAWSEKLYESQSYMVITTTRGYTIHELKPGTKLDKDSPYNAWYSATLIGPPEEFTDKYPPSTYDSDGGFYLSQTPFILIMRKYRHGTTLPSGLATMAYPLGETQLGGDGETLTLTFLRNSRNQLCPNFEKKINWTDLYTILSSFL